LLERHPNNWAQSPRPPLAGPAARSAALASRGVGFGARSVSAAERDATDRLPLANARRRCRSPWSIATRRGRRVRGSGRPRRTRTCRARERRPTPPSPALDTETLPPGGATARAGRGTRIDAAKDRPVRIDAQTASDSHPSRTGGPSVISAVHAAVGRDRKRRLGTRDIATLSRSQLTQNRRRPDWC
jgi:hypothetical protein